MTYTIKEINAARSYSQYTVVGLVQQCQLQSTASAWEASFKNVEVLYFANKDAVQGTLLLLCNAQIFGCKMWYILSSQDFIAQVTQSIALNVCIGPTLNALIFCTWRWIFCGYVIKWWLIYFPSTIVCMHWAAWILIKVCFFSKVKIIVSNRVLNYEVKNIYR